MCRYDAWTVSLILISRGNVLVQSVAILTRTFVTLLVYDISNYIHVNIYITSIAEMGDSFRDAAWDNQLDTMLDDLQASVQAGGSETHGYKNGYHSANGGKIGLSSIISKI